MGYDYVLVLEVGLLRPAYRPELHEHLVAAGAQSQLVVCNSGDDVRVALADACITYADCDNRFWA